MSVLQHIAQEIEQCNKCGLCETRTLTVPGEGNPNARLMFIGEGPGANEDKSGRPFVGRAGQLLDRMLEKCLEMRREDVFIANMVKCRPPNNRNPEPQELNACRSFLDEQIVSVDPLVIVTLGKVATCHLLDLPTYEKMKSLRNRDPSNPHRSSGEPWIKELGGKQRKVVPTWHPAYLLRTPSAKHESAMDMAVVKKILEVV